MKRFLLLLFLFSSIVHAQVGGKITQDPWVSNRQGYPAGGTNIAICQPLATTGATLTSNLAIFTMSSNPITAGFVNGMTIQVSGFAGADTYFNNGTLNDGLLTGGLTILSVSPTQIIVSLVHANGTASTTGTILQFGNSATPCAGLVPIYTDASLTTGQVNPLVADGLGNYSAGAVPGTYYVQYYGSGITTTLRQIVISCSVSMVGSCGAGGGGGGGGFPTKGPNPWADVTAFGARTIAGGTPSSTVSCNGTSTVTVTGGLNWGTTAGFIPGDGITIYGCGATNTMGTPTGLTVTPSVPWGPTLTRSMLNDTTASSTYQYTVFARDVYGALTAPITPVTITNGQATLGLNTCTIASTPGAITRSNDRVIFKTTSPCILVVGQLVELLPTNSGQFYGWYNIAQVDSSTQFEAWTTAVDTRAQGWMIGDTTTSANGGTVAFYQGNFLKWTASTGSPWEYYVCAKRPGDSALQLIGITQPTGAGGYNDVSFEDYGSPYMDNQSYPAYVTNANCTGSATNDPLTTTIVSSPDNGTHMVLVNTASQTISGTTAVFDDAPGILAAANSIAYVAPNYYGGTIFFPAATGVGSGYVINSYLPIPANLAILQSGAMSVYETINLAGTDNWNGNWGSRGAIQFGPTGGPQIYCFSANPCMYLTGTADKLEGFVMTEAGTNGGIDIIADSSTPNNLDYISLGTPAGPSDYLGMTFVARGTGSQNEIHFNHVLFYVGPNGTPDASWTPAVWLAPAEMFENVAFYLTFDNVFWNRRGLTIGGGNGACTTPNIKFNYSYRQGGITPMVSTLNCPAYTQFTFNDVEQDTEGEPLLAALISTPTGGALGPHITAHFPTGGNSNPLFSGARPSFADIDSAIFNSAKQLQNRDVLLKNGGNFQYVYAPYATSGTYAAIYGSLDTIATPMHGAGGYSWWFDLLSPTSVTATAAAGGSVPAGTYVYAVTHAGVDGGETIPSAPSAQVTTVGGGNQTVNVAWTNTLGAVSSNVWRCNLTTNCLNLDGTVNVGSTWYRVALHQTGTTYSDTAASPTRFVPPYVTGTGVTGMNSTQIFTPEYLCPETSAPSGLASFDILYCDSTSHRLTAINNNGTGSGMATLADFASPPTIGSVTPGIGDFTSMVLTGNLTTNVTGSTQCIHVNSSGVVSGAGSDCGISSGSTTFSAITSSTNTAAAMVVGTGASLGTSGSGTITATALPFSGLSSSTNTTGALVLGTGASLTVSGSGTNNATTLLGTTWASPAAIGTGTPAAGTFSNLIDSALTPGTLPICPNGSGGLFTTSGCVSGGSVFPVTVSGTTTSGGIPYFSNTTTETSSGILNTNILVKGGGAGGAPTNSSITDNGTTVSTSEPLSSGNASFGGGCSAAGSTASGGICDTESANTGWTPTSGQDYMRADSTLHAFICSINGAAEPGCTFGAPTTVNNNGIATTPANGGQFYNTTAATAGVPNQYCPSLDLEGNVWNTTSVATNNVVHWFINCTTNSGTTPFSTLNISSQLNGGSITGRLSVNSFGQVASNASIGAATYVTATNCAANGTAANPSVVSCGSAAAGMFSCATNASTGTCQVNTTAVTANSEIFVTQDQADGGAGQLNVTCNTGLDLPAAAPVLKAKATGTSFTINLGTVSVNPACFEYYIIN